MGDSFLNDSQSFRLMKAPKEKEVNFSFEMNLKKVLSKKLKKSLNWILCRKRKEKDEKNNRNKNLMLQRSLRSFITELRLTKKFIMNELGAF